MADYLLDFDSDEEDELFALLGARGRLAKIIRPRVNHFDMWTDAEFFMRFRLTKPTVLLLLDQIVHQLEHQTDRLVGIFPCNACTHYSAFKLYSGLGSRALNGLFA